MLLTSSSTIVAASSFSGRGRGGSTPFHNKFNKVSTVLVISLVLFELGVMRHQTWIASSNLKHPFSSETGQRQGPLSHNNVDDGGSLGVNEIASPNLKHPFSSENGLRQEPLSHNSVDDGESLGVNEEVDNTTKYATFVDGDSRWRIEKRPWSNFAAKWSAIELKYAATNKSDLDLNRGWGFSALLEMEDRHNRMAHCLESYFMLWREEEPFSGEPFFDWIDYGSGRELEAADCSRHKLNKRSYYLMKEFEVEGSVVNFNVTTRNNTAEVHLSFAVSGESVPTGDYLSIWDLDQKLHLLKAGHVDAPDNPRIDHYKQGHSSVTHGMPVRYAGEMGLGENGKLLWSNPDSGHYKPALAHTLRLFRWMREEHGIPYDALEWQQHNHGSQHKLNATEWEMLFT